MPTTLPLHPTGQVLTVPTSWADVTLQQYLLLNDCADPGDQRTAAEVLLGLEAGGLGQLDARDVVYFVNLLAFTTEPLVEVVERADLPDVGGLPYLLLSLVLDRFTDHADRPDLWHAPYILALYRSYLTWGKHDEKRVAACEAALLAGPVLEAYALGLSFFLAACRKWSVGTPQTPPTSASPPTKKKRPILTRLFKKGSVNL